jgi:hypothetical protein
VISFPAQALFWAPACCRSPQAVKKYEMLATTIAGSFAEAGMVGHAADVVGALAVGGRAESGRSGCTLFRAPRV